MGTQQVQQPAISQKRKGLPWKQVRRIIYILVVISLLFFIVGAIIWILITLGTIHGPVFDKLFVIFNGLGGATIAVLAFFGIIQFILSLIPNPTEPITATSSAPSAPATSIVIPPIPPTPQPTPVPRPGKASYRGIVGIPPPTDPKTIQQREKTVWEVYDKLIQPDITAIALTGIGGIGKSTLAALIYRYAEAQQRAKNTPFAAPPIWMRIDPTVTIADILGNLSEALKVPVPDISTLSPQNQALVLFKALNSIDQPHLIVLDQFENVLDNEGHAKSDRPGIGEWLDALNSEHCTCRVLLTSRPAPQGTGDYPSTYLQPYPVEGLSEAEGIELLGEIRKVSATEADMRTAIQHCKGHALSLILLIALLQKRKLSLSTLLNDQHYMQLWTGDRAKKLLNAIYEQLDPLERKLLQSFSVYREPAPLEAALAIIDTNVQVPIAQVELALDGLLAQYLLQAPGEGRYQLHAIVATYVQDHFVEGNEQANQQALREVHEKAAQYYQQLAATSCPPRAERKQISDVHDLVEAIWQHIQGAQWQVAFDLMEQEGIFDDLNLWGGNAILLELYQLLLSDKWRPERSQAAYVYSYLAEVYYALGKNKDALKYCEQALNLYREVGDRKREGEELSDLGEVHRQLGKNDDALKYLKDALSIQKGVGDRQGEGLTLFKLSTVYSDLDNEQKALDYLEQALQILQEVGDRATEGATLNGLGVTYFKLRQEQKALDYFKQALQIRREIGYLRGEGVTLANIGLLYFWRNDYNVSLACFLLAKEIFEEIQSPDRNDVQGLIDDLHAKVGEQQFAVLLAQVEPLAYQIVEQALRERLLQGNRPPE